MGTNRLSKPNVAYSFSCPGCTCSDNGKTEQIVFEKTQEYVTHTDSAIQGHLDNYSHVEHFFSIQNMIVTDVKMHKFRLYLVCHNTTIIDLTMV